MCKCHYFNKETNKMERVNGLFSLNTANEGDIFKFAHENFTRKVLKINRNACETFAPPLLNYSGMDERGIHTFHLSFKAYFGTEKFLESINL